MDNYPVQDNNQINPPVNNLPTTEVSPKKPANHTGLIVAILIAVVLTVGIYAAVFRVGSPSPSESPAKAASVPLVSPVNFDAYVNENGAGSSEYNLPSMAVLADGGSLNPKDFSLTLHKILPLQIEARDQDYVFELPDFGIKNTLLKGQTTEVNLSGLGLGTFHYSCGKGCGGTVTVTQEMDAEE